MYVLENYIGGKFLPSTTGHLDSYDPSRGTPWAQVPDSGAKEAHLAVKAAADALDHWASLSASQRSLYLYRIADELERRLDEFAKIESKDQGKPEWLAKSVDIPRAVLNLRAFAQYYPHHLNECNYQPESNALNYTLREPVGVAALIVPWNLPLYLLTFKLAPALISGCTVIVKPSEMTSASAYMLCDIVHKSNLPAGVFNMVFGTGPKVGEELVRHQDVKVISFTGSTGVGKKIASIAAPLFKRMSLELGGKNAAILFPDVDISAAVATLTKSCFINQGEVCLATSRVFVHSSIYDNFLEAFVKAVRVLKTGPPTDSNSFLGALISKEHKEKVLGYIEIAKKSGAVFHCGEGVNENTLPQEFQAGYYVQPTIITNVSDENRCMQEEIFGPVVCVSPFENENEVIQRANNVRYGLVASIFGSNLSQLHRVASKLQVGTVWVNSWLSRSLDMPFGGTKESGIGRESTRLSLDLYTDLKTVSLNISTEKQQEMPKIV